MIPGSTPTKGRLLLATPNLRDPNFDRTVVYMLEHHAEGAVGVILNRPTDLPLHEPLDRWTDLEAEPVGLYHGGPVELDALIALGLSTGAAVTESEHMSPVVGRIASVDLTADPALATGLVERVRVFRGYAGWGEGQLEGELHTGSWIVVDAHDGDLFSARPADLWREVLRRQPGRLAWLADAPDDLELN